MLGCPTTYKTNMNPKINAKNLRYDGILSISPFNSLFLIYSDFPLKYYVPPDCGSNITDAWEMASKAYTCCKMLLRMGPNRILSSKPFYRNLLLPATFTNHPSSPPQNTPFERLTLGGGHGLPPQVLGVH